MRKVLALFLMVWFVQGVMAQEVDTNWRGIDNTFLYNRYAPRQDILVAQIVHYPIGEGMFVNMVMLQAQDSLSFEQLSKEFGFDFSKVPPTWSIKRDKRFLMVVSRDRYNPLKEPSMTPEGKVDNDKACLLIEFPGYHTLYIVHYKNEAECKQLLDLAIDKITEGDQF